MLKHFRDSPAFTAVEIVIVIAVVAILASIAIVGSSSIQRQARDTTRDAQVTVLAEALEKYHQENLEYPSVRFMDTATLVQIKDKLSLGSEDILIMPTAPASTPSIATSSPSPSQMVYAGSTADSAANPQCQDDFNGYCDDFQLSYTKEVGGATAAKASRGFIRVIADEPNPPMRQAIATGTFFACAVKNGAVYCWGDNSKGQLGNGGAGNSSVPVAVSTSGVLNGKTVTSIAATSEHACVIASSKVYCWGNNYRGQLGNGTNTDSNVPVAVSTSGVLNNKSITDISLGIEHTCALADGIPYCWGYGSSGEFGNGAESWGNSNVPVVAGTGTESGGGLNGKLVSRLGLGNRHTCAVADYRAYCWGANINAELGNNNNGNYAYSPNSVWTSGVLGGKNVTHIDGGSGQHVCAVASGAAYCWGGDSGHTAYVDGTLGSLGNGTGQSSLVPVAVVMNGAMNGKVVTDISASSNNTCAVADSKAFCWGSNSYGAIGNGGSDGDQQFSPVAVSDTGVLNGKAIDEISVGPYLVCAASSGSFYCWGYNAYGQLGNGSSTNSYVPVAVSKGAMP